MPANPALLEKRVSVICLVIYCVAATIGAFNGGLWAILGIGLAFILFKAVQHNEKKIPCPAKNITLLTLAVLAAFAAEIPLSSDLHISGKVWLQLASIFIPLLFLTSPRLQKIYLHPSFPSIIALAAGIGSFALGCELLSGGLLLHILKKPDASLTEYNRGIAHLVILAFPLFAGLWILNGKKGSYETNAKMLALAMSLSFASGLTESRTAKLALVVGIACTFAAIYFPTAMRRVLAIGSCVIMGWPLYAQKFFSNFYPLVEKLPPSWHHRAEIWDYLSYRIEERPIFGWGLGTTHTLDFTQPHGSLYQYAIKAAPHAHNFVTELWVETGLVGAALGFLFLLLSLRATSTLHASLQPFAIGCWVAAVTVSMFGFDFWTDALWAAFALSVFVFGILQQQIERDSNVSDA